LKLSVLIPAHNEEENIVSGLNHLHKVLRKEGIDHEILVVNDHSTDNTEAVLKREQENIPELRYVNNTMPRGFGYALRFGLDKFTGDCVAIVMADESDSPEDLVVFYRTMVEGNYDAVFGSRFMPGSRVVDYPKLKLFINRWANNFIRLLFQLKYNDVTNAFKLYRRETIQGLKPFLAPHFNLTVELPLKTIVRNYSFTWVPNSWFNRVKGDSKLKIQEMGSRYLFIVLYCLIEKYLTRGDYHKKSRE
jgi:dolichol-phosphate mannosyltransferase